MLTPDQLAALRAAAKAAHRPEVFWYEQDQLEQFTSPGADAAFIAAANPAVVLALLDNLEAKHQDLIGAMVRIGELESEVEHAEGARRTAQLELQQPNACTCPSGDGSLRWPCPTHPPKGHVPQ